MKTYISILLLTSVFILNACTKKSDAKQTYDLRTETIDNDKTEAAFLLARILLIKTLNEESIAFVPEVFEKSGKSLGPFEYPREMKARGVMFWDFVQNPDKQKDLEKKIRGAAKVSSLPYKDESGKEYELTLEGFDVFYGSSKGPKDNVINGTHIFIVPLSITVQRPKQSGGPVNQIRSGGEREKK